MVYRSTDRSEHVFVLPVSSYHSYTERDPLGKATTIDTEKKILDDSVSLSIVKVVCDDKDGIKVGYKLAEDPLASHWITHMKEVQPSDS